MVAVSGSMPMSMLTPWLSSSIDWTAESDPGSERRSGLVGGRPYRHAQRISRPVADGLGDAEGRSERRSSVLLSGPPWRSSEDHLARRSGRLPVHDAAGARPLHLAVAGGWDGDDLAGAARLPSPRDTNFMEWLAPFPRRMIAEDEPMNAIKVLGIDLGKDVCSVVGLDEAGTVLLRRRMRRDSVLKLAAGMPTCVMAMEACCGAHHLGRQLREQGHEVRLMSPEYVRPYVKAQKNDDRDAEAIAEAATRPTMRFVDLKSDEQLDMQSLHRARDRLIGERTALINQLRAILLEQGIVIAKGRRKLERELEQLLAGEMAISCRVRVLIEDMRDEWRGLHNRIGAFDTEFASLAREDASMKLLSTIPGIGPLNATAFVASVGKAETFGRGRDLAAWLGLVPRQMTTGGKPKLLGITKRGSGYLRRMLIHGAQAALPSLAKGATLTGEWRRGLLS